MLKKNNPGSELETDWQKEAKQGKQLREAVK